MIPVRRCIAGPRTSGASRPGWGVLGWLTEEKGGSTEKHGDRWYERDLEYLGMNKDWMRLGSNRNLKIYIDLPWKQGGPSQKSHNKCVRSQGLDTRHRCVDVGSRSNQEIMGSAIHWVWGSPEIMEQAVMVCTQHRGIKNQLLLLWFYDVLCGFASPKVWRHQNKSSNFWGLARGALLCRSAFSVRLSCWLIHGGVSLVSHDHTNILTSPITRILMLFQPRRWIEPTNYGLITICLIWHAPCAC